MVAPREVVPGRFYLCTRRCVQRQFRLRPDDETNQAFLYCLAYAALVTGVRVVAFFAGSNHHHLAVQDVEGRLPDFLKLFHTNLAKHQNVHHRMFENMWSSEKTSAVWCVDLDDLIEKAVYLLANPVKDDLVEHAEDWPGAISLRETLDGEIAVVKRPKKYFDANGAMPDHVELRCQLPDDAERAAMIERMRDGITQMERECRRVREHERRGVLGVRAILRQKPTQSPSSNLKKFRMNPQIASKAKAPRVEAIRRLKAFRLAYAFARESWLAGQPSIFPFGTWWLKRHAGVHCEACPH